jgi:hypothetical protein
MGARRELCEAGRYKGMEEEMSRQSEEIISKFNEDEINFLYEHTTTEGIANFFIYMSEFLEKNLIILLPANAGE